MRTILCIPHKAGESMNKLFLCLWAVSIVGCASSQSFRKSENGSDGYSIEDRAKPDQFVVRIKSQKGLLDSSFEDYVKRAVGETCSARGYEYFDVGWIDANSAAGYCYKSADAKALSIAFKAEKLKEDPPKFIIKQMNGKPKTFLAAEDEIISIDGQSLRSMDDLKLLESRMAETKKTTVKIRLVRYSESMTVNEPVSDVHDGILGPADLKKLKDAIFWNK